MKQQILVVSNGPVPAQPGFKIEGSGQRSWGLATGLAKSGYSVTVAIRDHYKVRGDEQTPNNINLVNWSPGKNLLRQANNSDTVLISYSTGKVAADLAKKIKPTVSLVLDCYVPIYVELSARNNSSQAQSLTNYLVDLGYFNTSLQRGDYFLCANEPQRHLYTGALSALGVINPHSYHQDRIIELPFGISNETVTSTLNPYKALGIPKDDFVLLWFGGLYPWFDITPLLTSIGLLRNKGTKISLVVVGGQNPYNNNPDFVSQYETAVNFCEQQQLLNNGVHFVDWVAYESRIDWYKNADAVININSPGKENEYSWRTRLMDYVWGGVPIITNGGDPLSEQLLEKHAALHLEDTSEQYLTNFLSSFFEGDELKKVTKNVNALRNKYYWERLVLPLVEALNNNPHPYKTEMEFERSIRFKRRKAILANSRFGAAIKSTKSTAVNSLKRGKKNG